jgi:hypothetical protein
VLKIALTEMPQPLSEKPEVEGFADKELAVDVKKSNAHH